MPAPLDEEAGYRLHVCDRRAFVRSPGDTLKLRDDGEDGGLSFHFDAIGLAAFACFATVSRCLGVMQTIFVCAAASLLIHLSMLLL